MFCYWCLLGGLSIPSPTHQTKAMCGCIWSPCYFSSYKQVWWKLETSSNNQILMFSGNPWTGLLICSNNLQAGCCSGGKSWIQASASREVDSEPCRKMQLRRRQCGEIKFRKVDNFMYLWLWSMIENQRTGFTEQLWTIWNLCFQRVGCKMWPQRMWQHTFPFVQILLANKLLSFPTLSIAAGGVDLSSVRNILNNVAGDKLQKTVYFEKVSIAKQGIIMFFEKQRVCMSLVNFMSLTLVVFITSLMFISSVCSLSCHDWLCIGRNWRRGLAVHCFVIEKLKRHLQAN